ncbi:unnamed protein product [Alopecurus aequalis]
MAHGKVQMRRIENPAHRQVTFCKRRMCLLKKANELSVLCDVDVGVMVFCPRGKIYELATNGNMQGLIGRCMGSNMEAQGECIKQNNPQVIQQEVLLRQEIDLLQKGVRKVQHRNINHMNLHELHALESNLELWAHNIRSAKMQIISREIEVLKNKMGLLKATNDILQERINVNHVTIFKNMMIPQFSFEQTMERGHYF